MSEATTEVTDPEAPFGREEDGSPKAPYGFKSDGSVKRAAGGRPPGIRNGEGKGRARERARRRPGGSSAPPKRPARPRSKTPRRPDYARGVMELMQGPMIALTIGGVMRPELLADARALELHMPPLAAAIGDLAEEKPEVAAMLDRLMVAGPYTALITAVVPLALQLAANHNVIRAGMFGTQTKAELLGGMEPPTPEQVAAWQAAQEAAFGAQSAPEGPPPDVAPPGPPFEQNEHHDVPEPPGQEPADPWSQMIPPEPNGVASGS